MASPSVHFSLLHTVLGSVSSPNFDKGLWLMSMLKKAPCLSLPLLPFLISSDHLCLYYWNLHMYLLRLLSLSAIFPARPSGQGFKLIFVSGLFYHTSLHLPPWLLGIHSVTVPMPGCLWPHHPLGSSSFFFVENEEQSGTLLYYIFYLPKDEFLRKRRQELIKHSAFSVQYMS